MLWEYTPNQLFSRLSLFSKFCILFHWHILLIISLPTLNCECLITCGTIFNPFTWWPHQSVLLKSFPFLNFIGFFVAAALGADDVFVAVDKWKNARLSNPEGTTGDVAAVALTSAASAMLLTTSTTAVAFFATTICPVAPILCFAVFCGLLIVFNYFLNIAFIFPALCIYDRWLINGRSNFCIACCMKSKEEDDDEEMKSDDNKKESLIHRILTFYFILLHKFRYFLCAAIVVTLGISIWAALGVSNE